MGPALSNEETNLFSQNKTKLIITGLDNTGKTSILYQLKVGEYITREQFIRKLQCNEFDISIFDLGGEDLMIPRVRAWLENVQAIIYVVDCEDIHRIDEAKRELKKLLKEDNLKNSILLVLANKQDLPRSIKSNELENILNLKSFFDHEFLVQGTSAKTGEGILEALKWLTDHICKNFLYNKKIGNDFY